MPIRPNPVSNNEKSGKVVDGPISLFASHPTAANLIMLLMLVAGAWGITKMNSQFLPSFGIDVVNITVKWPGANSEDIDNNIIQLIEPEVRFLDSVKRVRSTSYEGSGVVSIEFEAGSDMQSALSNIESSVSRITTLPVDSEKPEIKRIIRYETITRLVLSGDISELAIKAHAKRIRDDLLARGIDKIDLFGSRNEEILVEADEKNLRRLDLTLSDIAAGIEKTSVDLPSGNIGRGLRQVRSLGLLTNANSLGSLEIKSLGDGQKLYLRDVANVREAFEDGGAYALRKGNLAIELHLQRSLNTDALVLAKKINEYVEEESTTWPPNLIVEKYDTATNLLDERINLLVRNGISGLVLVMLILFIFLEASVAFWVLLGIPICFMATFGVMLATGQSINMISLFGLIMALGIVVDDAIVVGEHAEYRRRTGLGRFDSAVAGARRMAAPVVCAALTTMCSFLPLILIGGIIGQVIAAIPLVIVAVLLASLLECFYVLPGHLSHGFNVELSSPRFYTSFREKFDKKFNAFRDGKFRSLVKFSVEWRYATLAATIALLIAVIGLVASGRIGFNFFPTPESDKVIVNVKMVSGTPRSETVKMIKELERAAYAAAENKLGSENNLIKMSIIKVGIPISVNANLQNNSAFDDAIGGLIVELLTADKRTIRLNSFIKSWREEVQPIAGLKNYTIQEVRGGPPGRDIDIRLMGSDIDKLKLAGAELITLLRRYPGVNDIEDDIPYGKREVILEVTKRGRSLGFSTEDVGRQVRNAIEGRVAKRFARDDEEIAVRVQYPRSQIKSGLLDSLYLRAKNGKEVPLSQVVKQREKFGFAKVKRENGSRQIAVTADIDSAITSVGKILSAVEKDGVYQIARRYGLEVYFSGKAEEEQETFADMKLGMLVGLSGIYIVLAWAFASYSRPFAVMAVIPMGFIGAVIGHWLLGYNLTILSLIGLVGLSGIVINGSIILATTVDQRIKSETLFDAIIGASCDRFRPIILTSITTIGGLTPLMFERSMQAQFLIPMAITIVFGLGIATLLILFVVPSLIVVTEDIRVGLRTLAAKYRALS